MLRSLFYFQMTKVALSKLLELVLHANNAERKDLAEHSNAQTQSAPLINLNRRKNKIRQSPRF